MQYLKKQRKIYENLDMNNLKKHWKEIVIVLLVLFGLNKCTQSCSRGTKLDIISAEYDSIIVKKDSTIKVLNDSINAMNVKIQVYEEKGAGLKEALNIQDEANKRISEAKKNINVNVRK